MKHNEQNMPPVDPRAPEMHDRHGKHKKREKRRRRGPSFGFIFLLIIILAVAAFIVLWKNGLIHIGREAGQGAGNGGTSSAVEEVTSSAVESTVVEIKVDEDKIYIDGTQVASAEELKEKITAIGDKKTYNFVHESALKATYDDVKTVLSELERALNIKVDYNDDTSAP